MMIADHHPDLIISTGCAGGADTRLNVGDVVVANACVYHDAYCGENCNYGQILGMPARYMAPKDLVDKAIHMQVEGIQVREGLTVSGEWFVDSREKMREIMTHFPEATATTQVLVSGEKGGSQAKPLLIAGLIVPEIFMMFLRILTHVFITRNIICGMQK